MRHMHEEVHEELHVVGCCIIMLCAFYQLQRQLPFSELSYDCSLVVVSQSTHHYLSLVLTKRTHRVVETAKKWSEHGADYALCSVHDSAEFESSLIKCSVSFVHPGVVFLT